MTLETATAVRRNGTGQTPRVVLSARGLRRDFAGFVAVKDVDLDVHHAKIHALIGPNGAGKTTIFNLLTKFLQPTSGTIELLGTDITRMPPARVARMGLVRSFQISAIFPHLSVLDNVRVALQRPGGLGYQFWRSLSALDELAPRARELLAIVGLDDVAHRLAGDLSYGEPMAGMGHEDVGMISGIIRSLAKDRAVLMVEHNLTVVADLCDWITVMQRGQVLAAGDYATVSQDERVRVAYMGTEHE
ncbi:MAG: ABC transporter ATP-binding protein [Mesorhizobium sp.]|nr:MAG: ABC transporter ATP-binding protein [Mesorhizobium sp.]